MFPPELLLEYVAVRVTSVGWPSIVWVVLVATTIVVSAGFVGFELEPQIGLSCDTPFAAKARSKQRRPCDCEVLELALCVGLLDPPLLFDPPLDWDDSNSAVKP
jgi:hypothetical protein